MEDMMRKNKSKVFAQLQNENLLKAAQQRRSFSLNKNTDKDRAQYLALTQKQQIYEDILRKDGNELSESKKQWMKAEINRLEEEKKKNCLPAEALIKAEHLSNLKLSPKQLANLNT